MRVGFDARFMAVPGGLGRYCAGLLNALAARYPDDQFIVLARKLPLTLHRPNVRLLPCDIPWYGFAEQTRLGLLMNAHRDVDLWHIPHWNVPLLLRAPFVMTVHDFIADYYPTHQNKFDRYITYSIKRLVWRFILKRNVRRAKAIITVSCAVRDELTRRFPSAADKTRVVHNGVSLISASIGVAPAHPYFLLVGNSYPHKNHKLVFRAFELLTQSAPHVHLYVITHADRFSHAAAQTVAAGALADKIHFLFDAPDAVLTQYYHHALALIFPSLKEGFGIPPLEALQAGTPVIAARCEAIAEMLGDHALWIDANDHVALARTLQRMYEEPMRATNEAQQHAFQFTWDAAAVQTMSIYSQTHQTV